MNRASNTRTVAQNNQNNEKNRNDRTPILLKRPTICKYHRSTTQFSRCHAHCTASCHVRHPHQRRAEKGKRVFLLPSSFNTTIFSRLQAAPCTTLCKQTNEQNTSKRKAACAPQRNLPAVATHAQALSEPMPCHARAVHMPSMNTN